jgi:hypothetical protein
MRRCKQCGEEKDAKQYSGGWRWVCKACRAERERERRRGPEGDLLRARERGRLHSRLEQRRRRRRAVQTPPPHRWWPIERAECELGLGYYRVHLYIQSGLIAAHTYIRRVYVDPKDVEAVRLRREAGDRSIPDGRHVEGPTQADRG